MTQDDMKNDALKQQAAKAAIKYIEEDSVIGIGTGSTVDYFIDELVKFKHIIEGAVSSSEATTQKLKQHGITVYDLTSVSQVAVYIDGADEVNSHRQLVKGGGGALTREKIIAAAARKFVCIVDESKLVGVLGEFPIAVEVIPMARSYVAREIVKMGGDPAYREDFVTDNGNVILDVYNLQILEPIKLETQLNQITGVVCNGIFAAKPADEVVVAKEGSVYEL